MKTNLVAKPWISPARRYTGLHGCPCGYYSDQLKACTCSSATVTRYQKRISGPLLDRIDIHVEVPRVEYEKLSDDRLGEPSAVIRERVEAAELTAASGLARVETFRSDGESGRLNLYHLLHCEAVTGV